MAEATGEDQGFDAKLKRLFGDRVVEKGLAREEAFFRLPRFVTEYLLAKYVKPDSADADIERLKGQIRDRLPDLDRRELIKDRLMREGHYTLLDQIEARVDLKAESRWAAVPSLDDRNVRIGEAILAANPGLLAGGMWGTLKLWYRPEADPHHPLEVAAFTPFQVDVTTVEDVIAARKEFSTEEWVRLLLASAGFDAAGFSSDRQRLLVLSRLLPLVERNLNLIELGPRQTGKTFLLRNTSPQVFLLSGGKATPANLFVNLASRSVGILGLRKVVVFDEIASTTFGDAPATISILKDYMESGQFSRGAQTYVSEASLFLAGNIDVEDGRPHPRYRHLFEVLPEPLQDTAFLDRIHGYLPGWEIPKVTRAALSRGLGFVTDYFGEYLLKLRNLEFRGEARRLQFNQHLTQRDLAAVERITSGLLKLLHPDGRATESELAALASLAVEMRQRVHDQLSIMAPGEFKEKRVAFEGMVPSPAADMAAPGTEEIQRYDRLNHEAVVGEVTGLSALLAGSEVVGADLIIVEASLAPGSGVEVVGGRGKVLRESVRAAYQLLLSRSRELGLEPETLARNRMVVHLLHIAEEREGPSAGAAFVVAMASAASRRPVKPGVAVTGEVSLHGKVTGVGAVAQKALAAVKAGRTTLIVPRENAGELAGLPDAALSRIELVAVDRIEEVLAAALLPAPPPSAPEAGGG
jgi:ATP-dependent Lon protease